MSTVQINNPMKALLLKSQIYDYANNAEHLIVSLFDGPMPTQNQLLANATYDSNGFLVISSAYNEVINNLGCVELMRSEFNNFQDVQHSDFSEVVFRLSKRTEYATWQPGDQVPRTATWFMVHLANEGSPAYGNNIVRFVTVGNVGLLDSGADWEFTNLDFNDTSSLKFNDFVLNLDIQGS